MVKRATLPWICGTKRARVKFCTVPRLANLWEAAALSGGNPMILGEPRPQARLFKRIWGGGGGTHNSHTPILSGIALNRYAAGIFVFGKDRVGGQGAFTRVETSLTKKIPHQFSFKQEAAARGRKKRGPGKFSPGEAYSKKGFGGCGMEVLKTC